MSVASVGRVLEGDVFAAGVIADEFRVIGLAYSTNAISGFLQACKILIANLYDTY